MRFNAPFFRDLLRLTQAYYVSEEKKSLLLLFFGNIALSLIKVRTNVAMNTFSLHFYDALQNYDTAALIHLLLQFSLILVVLILSSGYAFYLSNLLSLRWRLWMTRGYLKRWTHAAAMQPSIENPDQRISEDISLFTSLTINLFFILFESLLTLAWFGYLLWNLSDQFKLTLPLTHIALPGYLFWGALSYAVIGTAITAWIGRHLATLNYQEQHYNADFRYALVRQRDTKTTDRSIPMEPLLNRIFDNVIAIISAKKQLLFFTSFYNSAAFIVGLFMAIPLYLQKKMQLGGVMQISGAFSYVITACSTLINHYGALTEWRSVIFRLTEFNKALEQHEGALVTEDKLVEHTES